MQAALRPRKEFQNLGFGGVLFSLFFAAEKERVPPEAAQKFWAPQQDHRPLRMGTCGYEFGDQRRNEYEKMRILWERS